MKKCPFCAEDIQDAAVVCKHCGRDLQKRAPTESPRDAKVHPVAAAKQSVSPVVVVLVLLMVGGFVYWQISGGSVTGPANSYLMTGSVASGGVTLSQFQSLRDGMTYAEAIAVLGSAGTEQSRSDLANIVTVMYSWPGSGTVGANMNAMFQNDKLITKAQFGLR